MMNAEPQLEQQLSNRRPCSEELARRLRRALFPVISPPASAIWYCTLSSRAALRSSAKNFAVGSILSSPAAMIVLLSNFVVCRTTATGPDSNLVAFGMQNVAALGEPFSLAISLMLCSVVA